MMSKSKEISVLVVDNNPVIVKTLSSFLSKEGCRVVTAEDGLIALELLRKDVFDIVFTDLVMPCVEGDVLCRIIRSKPELAHLYVVILSAIAAEAQQGLLADVDYDLCFEKGHILQLKKQVKEALLGFRTQLSGQQKKAGLKRDKEDEGARGITNELLLKSNYLHSILTNLNEGVIELNHQGLIIGVNPAAEMFFSLSKEECIGHFLHDISDNTAFNYRIRVWQEQVLSSSKIEPLHITEDTPLFFGERVLTCEATIVAESNPAVGICIFHDITRQYHAETHKKKVQNALGGMKKMDAMRDMAGGFAHDFNNLLTAICGNLDILRAVESASFSERAIKIVENTKKAAGLAVDLTKKISTFSDFGIVERRQVHIQQFLSDCCASYFTQHNTPYQLDAEKEPLWFDVNPEEVRDALTNIFENSLEALEDKRSTINLTQERICFEDSCLVANQYIPAGEYVKITIADTGIGIAEEDMAHIFDPYFSSKERSSVKGLGLGLAVVYSVMRSHGGYVVAYSEEGKGTQISLFFPFKHKQVTLSKGNQIFLIEQDEQLRESHCVFIEFLGLTVFPFTNEDGAFSFFRERYLQEGNSSTPSAAVICDFESLSDTKANMIVEKWRRVFPEVVFIGSYKKENYSAEGSLAQNSGFDAVMESPFSMPILQKILAQYGMIPFLK